MLSTQRSRYALLVGVLVGGVSCGPDRVRTDAGPPPDDAGSATDAGADAATPDAGGSTAAADIREVLDCGDPNGPSGPVNAGDLQLHTVDLAAFPDALCNDGTPAVLQFRPYRGEENRNRWVISLRGGGGCGNGESCAGRWCGCSAMAPCGFTEYESGFDLNNMSGGGPRTLAGGGVMRRDGPANPLADFNHVQFVFCSSDAWAGNARGVTYTVTHPRTGEEVTYTMHFLGSRILAADLATLRQDGAPALEYTASGGSDPMPDLDEAETVVMVGDSGGGAGLINQLDAIADLLRAEHVGSGEPQIAGIIDAIVGPELSRLDWSNNRGVSEGVLTYDDAMAVAFVSPANAGASFDATCLARHVGTEGECSDLSHVIRHHITTPFFVRMALLDFLIADGYRGSGLEDPDLGPFVLGGPMGNLPIVFGTVLQRELAEFPNLPSDPDTEEGTDMTVAPGVFAPACSRHDTIHSNEEVYGTSIDPTGTDPLFFFDVFGNWRTGADPAAVLTQDPMRADTICAP